MRLLNKLEETIIATLLAGSVVVVLAAVLQRYGLTGVVAVMSWAKANDYDTVEAIARSLVWGITSIRLTWAQELTIFMLIWMAKFGAAYGVRTGIHVGVDLIVQRTQGATHAALVHVGLLAGALFTGIVALLGARFVHHLYGTGHYAAVLDVPMWAVYLAVPLGSALMCFRFLEASWRFHRTGELAKHDPGALPGLDDAGAGRPR